MDHSCLIRPERRLIAQAEHIPVHLGSMALAVREGLAAYKGKLEPGDMILLNDPYLSGTHLPDLTLIAPIFSDGRLIGYAANKAHHTDVGGKAPGSIAGDSTELYQEGLIIPPIKFVKAGTVDPELAWLLRSNVRTPDVQMGDLRAQIAANNTGVRRVVELVGQYGAETLHEAMGEIMDYSERRMRAAISEMPRGSYEAFDYMEDVPGLGLAEIKVKVTIDDEALPSTTRSTCPQVESTDKRATRRHHMSIY
jgi:N-methylhydantoinase B